MNKLRRLMCVPMVLLVTGGLLAGCGNETTSQTGGAVNVVTREEGSGTRGAFVELFSIVEEKEGEKVDQTSPNAIVSNSTAVVMTTVAGDKNAIGYVSLGSVNDTIKTVEIDGATPSIEQVKENRYKISRPFNIVLPKKVSQVAQDFIQFMMSPQGQQVVEETGYIAVDAQQDYQPTIEAGKVVISGSSSVTPVMEKLKEAYLKVNPGVIIEIQQSDSSTGVTNTIDGTANIGMASRELKESELAQGVTSKVMAIDGIAVIVNKENPITQLTSEQVKNIFTGNETSWDNLLSK
ncbi:substrate-binding domain-containing protein [Atopobacter phocae]|uniref:substrate-binding domain-containing protein n=1 Tax=Atopobacter phocae TaxID=136492 RepID=UPI00046F4123|nr:substrate-binding domain-containing protein [Atopobacter phocae]